MTDESKVLERFLRYRINDFEDGLIVERMSYGQWVRDSDKVFRFETAEMIVDLRLKGIPWKKD